MTGRPCSKCGGETEARRFTDSCPYCGMESPRFDPPPAAHLPVTTLAELDALVVAEVEEGYRFAEAGDPEPGANHTRSHHHGWRVRMMDLRALDIPPEHRELTRVFVERMRAGGGS